MSIQYIKDEMLNWKKSLEKEIDKLNEKIEQNDLNAKINEYKRNIINDAAEKFSIADDVRHNFNLKYGQPFQSSLDDYYQNNKNTELSQKVREYKCIVRTIEKWIELN